MKFLFDLFPIILFFAAFKLAGIFPDQAAALAASLSYQADTKQLPVLMATAAAIVGTLMQVAWVMLRHGKVDKMLWISLGLIVVLGGATLLLHDEVFIKWKPTALYWLFATVLLASASLFKKNLIQAMLGQQMSLPELIWARLNQSWAAFFTLMGMVNLYVAFNFPIDTWVNFKLFGFMGLMIVFVIAQSLLLSKYIEEDKEPK